MTRDPGTKTMGTKGAVPAVPPLAHPVLELEPRGLNRVLAAAYVGVSPTLFDTMVDDGRMPKPKRVNARVLWDKRRLDEAFDALPGDEADDSDPWGED